MTHESILAHTGADPGFVGPEAYTVLGASIYEKGYKIMKTKLGTKVNIYLEWERKSQQFTDFKKLINNPPQYPEK